MKRNVYIVPVITFLVGFFSFLVFSISNNVFWLTDNVDIPLFSSVAVMIGDSIFLPLINYMLFNLVLNKLDNSLLVRYKLQLITGSSVVLLISLFLNHLSHSNWSNDMISDFVSYRQGGLTVAGYWHYAFSVLQMALLLTFPFFWFLAIKSKNKKAIKYAKKIWRVLFIFTTLVIVDMLIKHTFFYQNKTFFESLVIERFPFVPCLLSVLLLLGMNLVDSKNITSRARIYNKLRRAA